VNCGRIPTERRSGGFKKFVFSLLETSRKAKNEILLLSQSGWQVLAESEKRFLLSIN